jgi:RimJ/RimL family protein N-acetyltransferase
MRVMWKSKMVDKCDYVPRYLEKERLRFREMESDDLVDLFDKAPDAGEEDFYGAKWRVRQETGGVY